MRSLVWLPLLAAAMFSPSSAQQHAPSAIPVATLIAEAKPVSRTKDFVGRIEAVERVEIRARVTGYLEAILFKEGELVKEGQPLYRIEQDLFKAAVEQAQGALEGSQASKKLSKVELDRANQLLDSSFRNPASRFGLLLKRGFGFGIPFLHCRLAAQFDATLLVNPDTFHPN